MGRHSYATVLALGLSPYQRPNNAEAQEFIIRQASTVPRRPRQYVQQYDERGHPQNPQTKETAKRLRRAHNEVLYTIGVVGKKEDKQKIKELYEENTNGALLHSLDSMLTFVGGWWLNSLTARFQTFEYYSTRPLTYILGLEKSRMGSMAFYTAGLPVMLASSLLQVVNAAVDACLPPSFSRVERFLQRFQKSLEFGLFVLSVPLDIFARLQALHIIPASSFPSLSIFRPFHSQSLFGLPSFPRQWNKSNVLLFSYRLITSPFFLLCFHTLLSRSLVQWLQFKVVGLIPKPDNPDMLSMRVSGWDSFDKAELPGLVENDSSQTEQAAKVVMADIRQEVAAVRRWSWMTFRRIRSLLSLTMFRSNTADPQVSSNMSTHSSLNELTRRLRGEDANLIRVDHAPDSAQTVLPQQISRARFIVAPQTPNNVFDARERNQQSTDMNAHVPPVTNGEHILSERITAASSDIHRQQDDALQEEMESGAARIASPDILLRSREGSTPSNTAPASPMIRASFLQRGPDAVILQLDVAERLEQNTVRFMELKEMYERSRNIIKILLGLQEATFNWPPSRDILDQVIRYLDVGILRALVTYDHCYQNNASDADFSAARNNFERETEQIERLAQRAAQLAMDAARNHQIGNTANRDEDEATKSARLGRQADEIMQRYLSSFPGESTFAFYNRHPEQITTLSDPAEHRDVLDPPGAAPTESLQPPTHLLAPTLSVPVQDGSSSDLHARANHTAENSHLPSRLPACPHNPFHRVTTLSNFPACALASNISDILCKTALLPLESLLFRSIADFYFSKPGNSRLRTVSLGCGWRNVRAMGAWLGGRGAGLSGMIGYLGTLALLSEMQKIVYHVTWKIGVWLAVRMGKDGGWGKL